MNRRALLVALAAAAIGVTLLLLYMRRFEHEVTGGETVELVMVLKKVERGTRLTEDMLTTRRVPIAYVEDRAVKANEKPKVIGLPTSGDLHAQQTLMWTDLAIRTEDRDLSTLVQPGKRGVTVLARADTRGNALIRPGDYVDVIVTTLEAQGGGQSAIVLLQKILVLAVGTDTHQNSYQRGAAEQRSHRDKVLTLSLNLKEAQLLSLATERGDLSVAVRNPEDQRVFENLPDIKSAALLDTEAREEIQKPSEWAPVRKSSGPVKIEGK